MNNDFKQWLKTNARPLAVGALYLALYLLAKFAPTSEDERQLLEGLAAAFGLFGTVFVPRFGEAKKAAQEQDQ